MNAQLSLVATGIGMVGGGRWAKVIASVLSEIVPRGTLPVYVLSPSAPNAWMDVASTLGWTQVASLDAMLPNPQISHVIIARRARDHAETAMAFLRHGKAVLIEKPACLSVGQWEQLQSAAVGRVCVTGHVFAYASNIIRFRAACHARGYVRKVTLFWGDPLDEVRHGAVKTFDQSLNVLQDILPHAWSILQPFAASEPMKMVRIRASRGGACVVTRMNSAAMQFSVAYSRRHPVRLRRIIVEGDGWKGALDFSREPGTATIDDQPLDVATGYSSPLRAQLLAFLSDTPLPETAIEFTRDAITLTVAGLNSIRRQQARVLGRSLDTSSARFALREMALGGIEGDGSGASAEQIADLSGVPSLRIQAALAALQS